MIIRKPYAFLIKNFRKIHIFLLILCGFIYYKCMQTRSFVTEFLQLETYDAYYEPITKYASVIALLVLLIIIGLSVVLVVLLRHKKKPWKLYIIPLVTYAFLFLTFVLTISLFSGYDSSSGTTGIRAINDLLFIGTLPQYAVIIILLMRIFGVDLNKFDFKSDQEYLELSNDDREEIEISVNIDKDSFKRVFKRLKRNIGYFYQEHRFLMNILASILVVVCVVGIYRFVFIVHKSYKQGDAIETNGYTISINHSYFTNKDYRGEVISKASDFVVLDITIKNNANEREVNFNRFHVMNGTGNYTQTYETYANDFRDLGDTVDKLTLGNQDSKRLLLVFKVDKDLNPDKFVLYYQELDNNKPYLRKIKLDMEDYSKIEKQKTKVLREEETIQFGEEELSFSIEDVSLVSQTIYNTWVCSSRNSCHSASTDLVARQGKLILQIFFASTSFTGKDFVDFSMEYGKIVYIDNKGKRREASVVDALDKDYNGNYMYLEVPQSLQEASEIRLVYTVRNKKYVYRLK